MSWLDDYLDQGQDTEPKNWLDDYLGIKKKEKKWWEFDNPLGQFAASTVAGVVDAPRTVGSLVDSIGKLLGIYDAPVAASAMTAASPIHNVANLVALAQDPKRGPFEMAEDTKELYENTRAQMLETDAPGKSFNAIKLPTGMLATISPGLAGLKLLGLIDKLEVPLDPSVWAAAMAQGAADLGPDAWPVEGVAKAGAGAARRALGRATLPPGSRQPYSVVPPPKTPKSQAEDAYKTLNEELKVQEDIAQQAIDNAHTEAIEEAVQRKVDAERLAMTLDYSERQKLTGQNIQNIEMYDNTQRTPLDDAIIFSESEKLAAKADIEERLAQLESTESIHEGMTGSIDNVMNYEPSLRGTANPLFSTPQPSGLRTVNPAFSDTVDDVTAYEPNAYNPMALPGKKAPVRRPIDPVGPPRRPTDGTRELPRYREPLAVEPIGLMDESNPVRDIDLYENPTARRELADQITDDALTEAERVLVDGHNAKQFPKKQALADTLARADLTGSPVDPVAIRPQLEEVTTADMSFKERFAQSLKTMEEEVGKQLDGTPETAIKAGQTVVDSANKATNGAVTPAQPPNFTKLFKAENALSKSESIEDAVSKLEATREMAKRAAGTQGKNKAGKLRVAGQLVSAEEEAAFAANEVQRVDDLISIGMAEIDKLAKDANERVKMIDDMVVALQKLYKLDDSLPGVRVVNKATAQSGPPVEGAAAWFHHQRIGNDPLLSKDLKNMNYRELVELGHKMHGLEAPPEAFRVLRKEVVDRLRKKTTDDALDVLKEVGCP